MKKLILPIFVPLLLLLAITDGNLLKVSAKEPWDIKINCPTVSSTLHFKDMGDPRGAKLCKTQEDQVAVSNTLVLLNGYVYTDLAEDLADPNQPLTTNVKPDKTEDLSIGDGGKIFYWGTPWGETLPRPAIEYRAKLGLCDMDLFGGAVEDIESYGVFGYKGDWQAAADYMVKKLSSAAKEIEANIAEECGAKGVVDTPKTAKESSSQKTAESLLDQVPTDDDLKPAPLPEKAKKDPLTAVIRELDGLADMQLVDGTWVVLKQGDLIPNDAKILVGFDSNLTLQFSDNFIATLHSLTEFDIQKFEKDPNHLKIELNVGAGDIRFKVLEGKFQTDMEVSTPNSTASIYGTDFGVAYDKESGVSIWEIYDGEVEVQNTTTGEKKTISSSYGSPIKRLEVTKNGSMIEKVVFLRGNGENFQPCKK